MPNRPRGKRRDMPGPGATGVPVSDGLPLLIGAELRRPLAPAVGALARRLAARAGGGGAAVVLFYGSALRTGDLTGVLDLYVLTDRPGDWPGSRRAAWLGRVLPPHVGYLEDEVDGCRLRAKYAVMTLAQFRRAMSTRRVDTTLWARFSQPSACAYARSAADEAAVADAVSAAVTTAARWAALLGPASGDAQTYWRDLFRRTYAAELRIEGSARADVLLAADAARYARLLPAAWQHGGLAFRCDADGRLTPAVDDARRAAAERRWRWRRRLGRPLNLLRLLKAASTFDNAIDYVAWKVERHSGYRIEPSAFQRRHPLLAAPALYWRLRARGVLR